ncbi:MAG TPA: bifunctional diaminohydroxyphosphoribosylaminopyrimidine deaminase/5-amino-6-(5-phosphoribosylamino)uracil reductase RibD [Nitriliruptorales bacterium]|nr:bifunctional diaminohydroxyphosphoribosylaminopyrimidine deaminase/5-amino-6-(5-phosphoribosylamino)uracil reductase RibD [Nitriliruptorales bacterium]
MASARQRRIGSLVDGPVRSDDNAFPKEGADSGVPSTDRDRELMGRALALAERGRATVRPNPMVGCVVVRHGEVVGEGWHERAGEAHAEVAALRAAGERVRGATVYVTLEPCAHSGRTTPCAPALAAAGVARVVYAAEDPNPLAAGGAALLRAAGVSVTGGVGSEAARQQNEVFFHVHSTGRPFVTLKLAQSLDGRVAARDGSSRWITAREARTAVHELRAAADAVVVGSGTVLADDPRLDVRHVDARAGQPRPAVVDRRGRTPPSAHVVRPGALVVTGPDADAVWRARLEGAGVEVVGVPAHDQGVDLKAALRALLDRELQALMVEGGPTLAGAITRAGLVDRLVLHLGGVVVGGDGLPSLAGRGAPSISAAGRWTIESVRLLGPDVEVVARPAEAAVPPADRVV